VVESLPGVARQAADAWVKAAWWSLALSLRVGSQLARVALDPDAAAELARQFSSGMRGYAREFLGVDDLDERIRELAPPAGALSRRGHRNGSKPEALSLRAQGAELLRQSADVAAEDDTHPAYARILCELAPDEARVLRLLAVEGPQPLLDVRAANLIGVGSQLVAPGLNMVGTQGGLRRRERVAAYLNNLLRLGLIRIGDEPLPDPIAYQVLEAQPDVLQLVATTDQSFYVRGKSLGSTNLLVYDKLHRLVQAILRTNPTRSTPTTKDMTTVARRLLRAAVPAKPWNDPASWLPWRQLLPHVLAVTDPTYPTDPDDTLEVAWLLDRAATYLHTRGEPRPARALFERAHQLRRDTLGADHPDTLASAHNLAFDLRALGEYQQARDLDEDTLTRRRQILGEEHPDTLISASSLAGDLHELGDYQQARELNENTLTRSRQVLGEDHLTTLTSASSLARDLRALGECQQARDLEEDTISRRRRVLGEDHPYTLTSASSLARDLRALGEYQQARSLNEDTLTRKRRVLSEDHPITLISAHNLARDWYALGEYQQARSLDEDTLSRRRRVLGEDHPYTLTSASSLARDLHALGEYQQARELNEDTLTRSRQVLGENHPDTLISASNLALDLDALGEDQQARELEEWVTRQRGA